MTVDYKRQHHILFYRFLKKFLDVFIFTFNGSLFTSVFKIIKPQLLTLGIGNFTLINRPHWRICNLHIPENYNSENNPVKNT